MVMLREVVIICCYSVSVCVGDLFRRVTDIGKLMGRGVRLKLSV